MIKYLDNTVNNDNNDIVQYNDDHDYDHEMN